MLQKATTRNRQGQTTRHTSGRLPRRSLSWRNYRTYVGWALGRWAEVLIITVIFDKQDVG